MQKVRPGDVNSYYVYGYKIEEAEAGVSPERFAEAVRAEGIPDCYGPYAGGVPMYKTGMFVNEHTYGRSRYPFVDEQGRRRVDYTKVRLPNVESELPKTGFILLAQLVHGRRRPRHRSRDAQGVELLRVPPCCAIDKAMMVGSPSHNDGPPPQIPRTVKQRRVSRQLATWVADTIRTGWSSTDAATWWCAAPRITRSLTSPMNSRF